MAEEIRKVIHIDTSRSATSVKDLRDEIKSLRDALVQLDSTSEQYVQIAQQVAQREQKLAQVMSASKNVITPYQRSLNALTATYSNQRQELRALRTALENLDPATAEYRAAFERAAEITHDLQERQELLRRSSSDLGVQLDNMRDIGTGLAAGWSSVNALMTLTGNNSEDLQKAMVKLQAGIALVQGMKGLEGLTKAIKGYITGSAKWYDKIKEAITGTQNLNKDIKINTDSLKTNTSAAQTNAGTITADKVAVEGLDVAQKKATTSAVALSTVLKSLAVSTGIGLAIAALTGLISLIAKAANAGNEALQKSRAKMEDWNNFQEYMGDQREAEYQRTIAEMRASGDTEAQIWEQEKKHHQERIHQFDDEAEAVKNLSNQIKEVYEQDDAWAGSVKLGKNRNILNTGEADSLGMTFFDDPAFKKGRMTIRPGRTGTDVLAKLEERIKQFAKEVPGFTTSLSDNYREAFNNITKNGIKTYQDLANAQYLYGEGVRMWKEKNETENEAYTKSQEQITKDTVLKTAKDGMKTRIEVLQEEKAENLKLFKEGEDDYTTVEKYYNKLIADERKKAAKTVVNTEKEKADTIVKRAKEAGQTELENLKAKYEEEKQLLIEYHKDTAALDDEYNKNRAKIIGKNAVTAITEAMAAYTNSKSGSTLAITSAKGMEDRLDLMGLPNESVVKRRTQMVYDYQKDLAEKEYQLWYALANNPDVDPETRVNAERKASELIIKIHEIETQKIIDDAKNRQKEVQRELDSLERQLNSIQQDTSRKLGQTSHEFNMQHMPNNIGEYMLGNKNPSYKELKEEYENQYQIMKQGYADQDALYTEYLTKLNLTDQQRTQYKAEQARLRAEAETAEWEHTERMAELTKDEYQTMIDATLSVADSFADILGSVADTMEAEVQHQLDLGQITEEQAEEQRKKIKAIQIAQTIVSTISGAIGAFTQASATIPPPAGQIVGGAAAAAVIAAGVASIAQMRATNKNTNSISNSLPIASPSMAGFEKDYEANMTGNSEVSALRNAIEGADIRAYVVESDITSAQSRSRRRSSESTF